jgi:hypothetical protein
LEPRGDPLDICIDDDCSLTESDRRDGGGCVRADPRKLAKLGLALRKAPSRSIQ